MWRLLRIVGCCSLLGWGVFWTLLAEPDIAVLHAASCSVSDVQEAVNQISSNGIVLVPAGTCEWQSTLRISNKALSLIGAGSEKTFIEDKTRSGGAPLILLEGSQTDATRISAFTFRGATGWEGMITVASPFRIDHCDFRFTNNTDNRGIFINSEVTGLIDNCKFTGDGVAKNGIYVRWAGFESWTKPYNPGTADAVFIEDSEFNFAEKSEGNTAFDGNKGSKVVFRFNRLHNSTIGVHGLDSGQARSIQAIEVYGNEFTNDERAATGIHIRGGTAIIFDNKFTGDWNSVIGLSSFRTCCPFGALCSLWRRLDGETEKLCSVNRFEACTEDSDCSDGGTCSIKFCSIGRDTVCSDDSHCPIGETCSGFLDGHKDASGYPGRDQIGRTANQILTPIYEWNNKMNGTDIDISVNAFGECHDPSPSDHIKEGRDFYNDTIKSDYSTYTYPHPLSTSFPPIPPSELHIVSVSNNEE